MLTLLPVDAFSPLKISWLTIPVLSSHGYALELDHCHWTVYWLGSFWTFIKDGTYPVFGAVEAGWKRTWPLPLLSVLDVPPTADLLYSLSPVSFELPSHASPEKISPLPWDFFLRPITPGYPVSMSRSTLDSVFPPCNAAGPRLLALRNAGRRGHVGQEDTKALVTFLMKGVAALVPKLLLMIEPETPCPTTISGAPQAAPCIREDLRRLRYSLEDMNHWRQSSKHTVTEFAPLQGTC
ncbi:hypothetical protein ONZ45_g6618 [Pleurotus djamor]|nr:hypothetical protein ONZ45_g6618 [Pleurotus djamor]